MDALAVHHSGPMEGYLKVQGLRADSATTEELREAMIRYRAMFEDLTGLREDHGGTGRDRVAEIRDRAPDRHAVAGDSTRVDETAAADFDAADRAGADRAAVDDAGVDDAAADRAAGDRGLAAEERERAARDRELAAGHVNRRADTPR